MRRRYPTQEEIALWRAALRGVTPLKDRASIPGEVGPQAGERGEGGTRDSGRVRGEGAVPAPRGRGLDKRTAQRLKRGELAIEARLDLHGLTEEEAHRATHAFLARAQAQGVRLALVITGKGAVLREAVPRWLDEGATRARVLATAAAQPRHGGGGALYVLLRRVR